MGVNGKSKGSNFERKIVNMLSERFKEHTKLEKSFIRSPSSGAFWGGKNRIRTTTHDLSKATFGDIIIPPGFKFNIECKHYKTPPSFSSIINQDILDWDKWLAQANQDALSANKKMLVIIKYNNVNEIVIIEPINLPDDCKIIKLQYKDHAIVLLEDFLKYDNDYFFDKE